MHSVERLDTSSAFGRRRPKIVSQNDLVSARLSRRLFEKIDNYERAARQLQTSGQPDAALVLNRAAGRLRHIMIGT